MPPVSLRPLIAGILVLVLAACASDAEPGADATTRDSALVATTSTSPVTEPLGTSPDEAGTTTPTPGTSDPATTAAADPPSTGPLVEPTISLFEIGSFDQPVDVATIPGDSRLFVVEQPGRVVAVTDLSSDVVLDITDLTSADAERGLLGLAFHPTDALVYADFTDDAGNTVIAEFAFDAATGAIDRDSLREVLTVEQPYANHNGGKLAFGPDGMLYIALGDGGSGGDPQRHALDLATRLGKILRIDPRATGDQPFTVPDDNPFVADPRADPAIWAYGLRNPWRFSFDPETGDLWIADVGQGDVEEIDHAPATDRAEAGKGTNFGWSAFEGLDRFNDDQSPDGATMPVYVYRHDGGRCSVSGGALARGTSVPDLDGWYVFGDYCSGEIWALDPAGTVDAPRVVALAELQGVAAISVGPDRELYAVSNAGPVMRIIAG